MGCIGFSYKLYSGNETVSFHWNKDGSPLDDETGSTYVPGLAGNYTVTVSAVDHNPKTSAAVPVTGDPLAHIAGSVTISGTFKVGETLTANDSVDGSGAPVHYQWQWSLTGGEPANIDGATGKTYVLTDFDAGHHISVVVSRPGSDVSGSITSGVSAEKVFVRVIDITGIPDTATVGTQLTLNAEVEPHTATNQMIVWTVSGAGTTGANITGGNKLNTPAIGTAKVLATITNGTETGNFTKEFTITVGWPALTGTVTITGDAEVGKTLTANTGSLGGSGTVTYQWQSSASSTGAFTDIGGATSSTYVLQAWDKDKYVRVTVKRANNSGEKSSDALGPVTVTSGLAWKVVDKDIINFSVYAIAFSNGRFIAGGSSGKIAYSDDGETWNVVAYSTFGTSRISGIASNGSNRWVAVGYDGKMAYSNNNGLTWTAIPPGNTNGTSTTFSSANTINAIIYANDRFYAVGSSNKIAHSLDGINWTAVTNTGSTSYTIFTSIAYGNGRWVAVGNSGSYNVSQTTNHTLWSFVTDANKLMSPVRISNIVYYGAKFIAMGMNESSFNALKAYSTDGMIWTVEENINPTDNSFISIGPIGYNGKRYVGGSNIWVYYSNDGINWTDRDMVMDLKG